MSEHALTRRGFLSQAAAGTIGGAVLAGCAATGPRSRARPGRVPGANDRISIGIIGSGERGSYLMTEIRANAREHNAEITAVCDVWQPNLRNAAANVKTWFGREPRTFTRFGDLLDLDDVDAVVIATPDFAHCSILIAALQAGKDVYVEKPMSIDLGEANRAFDLARAKDRVVQVGTQRRSEGRMRAYARVVASGALGTVSRVSAAQYVNHPRWARPYDNCRAADVDWDAYLFNRPRVPFNPRYLRRWHLYRMCSNGLSGLWMVHYVDTTNMIMGTSYPGSAVAHGGTYVWKEDREHADTFHALLDYPQGFLFSWGMGLANTSGTHWTVNGVKATLDIEKGEVIDDIPTGEKRPAPEPRKIAPDPSDSHMGNWLECIRSRRRPNADIEYGHQHTVATVMAAEAFFTGRRQVYDAKRRQIRAG